MYLARGKMRFHGYEIGERSAREIHTSELCRENWTIKTRFLLLSGMGPVAARDDGLRSALVPLRSGGQGGIVPPHSVVALESALGSVPTVALASAQVEVVVGFGWSIRHCSLDSFGVRYAELHDNDVPPTNGRAKGGVAPARAGLRQLRASPTSRFEEIPCRYPSATPTLPIDSAVSSGRYAVNRISIATSAAMFRTREYFRQPSWREKLVGWLR